MSQAEVYNFSENQTFALPRTKFKLSFNHKTTGNTGEFIPIMAERILPKDIVKLNTKILVKMTTPSFQTMDQAFVDVAYYFVPERLLWKNWKGFQGERTVGPREEQPQFTMPMTTAPEGGWLENTIADHLGIPTKVSGIKANSDFFRGYVLIWNEWYRDQNRQDFADFSDGDENTTGSNGNNYVIDALKGGKLLKVAKIHDYFTSTLLEPQAGEPVTLPIGISAPVTTKSETTPLIQRSSLKWAQSDTGEIINAPYGLNVSDNGNTYLTEPGLENADKRVYPANLWADLREATAATVNQLRQAFAMQRILEADNRGGRRYIEQLVNRWGIENPSDARLQRPEYLGGKRIPLSIDMVVQTNSTNETSPLGQISGFSNTRDVDNYFTKGFEEHGILFGFAYVRHQRTYQQGLHRKFTKLDREDFYMPEFMNLGEQAVYNYEIFASGNTTKDNQVFGYQEYGAEYRYQQNQVTGAFRSNANNSFDNWHYADDYEDTPVNSEEWIVENPNSVDRTLTLTSEEVPQFYFDIQFDGEITRSMPARSIPGLIDHH